MIFEWLIIEGIIERGLIFALCVMGVYLTSRIIHFDDLSVEGSFGLGGALMALLITRNIPWWIALPLVTFAGASAGMATGLLHTRLKLNNLISGIVVTTALFSINLKIAGSNMVLNDKATIFNLIPTNYAHLKLLLLIPLACGVVIALKWLLKCTSLYYRSSYAIECYYRI
jgi:putative tryptophan/tyrosine transport system permease protein